MYKYIVYVISCETPDHYYVGYSGDFAARLRRHQNGTGAKFVKRHGFKECHVIASYPTAEAAKTVETSWYLDLCRDGFTVGGPYSTDLLGNKHYGDPQGRRLSQVI